MFSIHEMLFHSIAGILHSVQSIGKAVTNYLPLPWWETCLPVCWAETHPESLPPGPPPAHWTRPLCAGRRPWLQPSARWSHARSPNLSNHDQTVSVAISGHDMPEDYTTRHSITEQHQVPCVALNSCPPDHLTCKVCGTDRVVPLSLVELCGHRDDGLLDGHA